MAIFAKQAYAAGFEIAPLLALRFSLAAAVFWMVFTVRRAGLPSRRTVVAGLAMGALGYAAQAGLYFGALTRIDASLTSLLLYTYPGLVFLLALTIGREHASPARLGALALATLGTALVLVGGGVGGVDGLGVALGLGAAVVYSVYILVADRVLGGADPFTLAALVMTGAAVATALVTLALGDFATLGAVGAGGYGWLLCVTLVSTVLAVSAFFAGMPLVGPATASIVSTVEPVVTIGLATAVFGESLGMGQLAGGVLVLGAVVVLQRRTGTVAADAPPDHATAAAPARALASEPARG
jgi:drug/metabolite transporter (DMT)-like permease